MGCKAFRRWQVKIELLFVTSVRVANVRFDSRWSSLPRFRAGAASPEADHEQRYRKKVHDR
jgi:hypothetical protein